METIDLFTKLQQDSIDLLNHTHLIRKFSSDEQKKLSNRIKLSSSLKTIELKDVHLNNYMLNVLMNDLPYNGSIKTLRQDKPPIGGSFKSIELLPTFGINGNM